MRMGNSMLYDVDLILQKSLNDSSHIFVISLEDDTINWSSLY